MDMWCFALAFVHAREVGASSRNVVSRAFPHFSQSMLTPMVYFLQFRGYINKIFYCCDQYKIRQKDCHLADTIVAVYPMNRERASAA